VRQRAGRRKHQKQHSVGEQIDPDREHLRKPAAQGDDDDLGDQIRGRNPAAVVDAGTDPALDIGQRGVDDLDVEYRHEGAEVGADYRDPGLERHGLRRSGRPFRRDRAGGTVAVETGGSGVDGSWEPGHGCFLVVTATQCIGRMHQIIRKKAEGLSNRD
jgi:hypothetical protein